MHWFDSITSTRKKRAATLFGLGCLATLSLPPFFLLPLLFVSSCGWLVLLMRAQTKGQAFRTGWWWGLGFFISGLYWICNSLLVDADRFAWMIPFALFGLNALIALFPALASVGFFHLRKYALDHILSVVLLFCFCWSLSEFARSHLLTGFPWNLVGYAWGDWLSGMQIVSIVGIHGLTLLTMLLSLTPLLYIRGEKQWAIRIVFAWMLIMAWGMWRVDSAPVESDATQPTIRVVQASIEQSLKWDPEERIIGIRKHMALTQQAEGKADIIVWPEAAVPMVINKEPILQQDLRALLAEGQWLITGGVRIGESSGAKPTIYSSVYTFNKQDIMDVYDKHHLVPFGEFVPLRDVLPIDKITPGDIDYSPGSGPRTVVIDDIPNFSPLICYEVIFPEEVVAKDQARPSWLVNLTNDAWFGDSTGPYQHLHMTRFRAIEQGLPLVRAANTGISAVVDSYGRIIDSMPLNHIGTMDVLLPVPIQPTIYFLLGNWLYLAMLAGAFFIAVGCVKLRSLHS